MPDNNIIVITNEKELHFKTINFIRKYYPSVIIIPGLGENQKTSYLRFTSKCKGYTSGQPDILLLHNNGKYNGLAIELKSPTGLGKLSKNQQIFLSDLENNNWETLVSNDYDEMILCIVEYMKM